MQEFPSKEIKRKELLAGPILRISCDKEVEFQEPVTLQLPLSLREKPKIPDSSLVRARVLFQRSDGENRQWTEITDSLESPPSFDETVIRFSVRHFSGYVKVVCFCCVASLHLLVGTLLFMLVILSSNGQVFRMLLRGTVLTIDSHWSLNRHASGPDTPGFRVSRIDDLVEWFEFRVIVSLNMTGSVIITSSDNS